MIVRWNTGYREFGNVPGYEHQVGIAVPLRASEPTGLPSSEENAELVAVEDAICQSLEVQAELLFVVIVTTGGMREFVFYTRAPQHVKRRFENLRGRTASHEIQLMIRSDETWEIYKRLTPTSSGR